MKTIDQKKPNNRPVPRWRRVINGLFFGAMCGSVLAIGITAVILGPSCYLDDRPSTIGGSQQNWAFIISSIWGAAGALLGGTFGTIVSLPDQRKWRFILAGIIVVVISAIMFVLNTTWFF